MRTILRLVVRIGALIALGVAVSKLFDWFKGSPEGVGSEGFSFGDDSIDPYAIDESKLGGHVSPELIERLVCPLDHGPLELVDGRWLVNPRNGYRYPIEDGIPVMLVEVGQRYRDASLAGEAPVGVPAPAGNGSST